MGSTEEQKATGLGYVIAKYCEGLLPQLLVHCANQGQKDRLTKVFWERIGQLTKEVSQIISENRARS